MRRLLLDLLSQASDIVGHNHNVGITKIILEWKCTDTIIWKNEMSSQTNF